MRREKGDKLYHSNIFKQDSSLLVVFSTTLSYWPSRSPFLYANTSAHIPEGALVAQPPAALRHRCTEDPTAELWKMPLQHLHISAAHEGRGGGDERAERREGGGGGGGVVIHVSHKEVEETRGREGGREGGGEGGGRGGMVIHVSHKEVEYVYTKTSSDILELPYKETRCSV